MLPEPSTYNRNHCGQLRNHAWHSPLSLPIVVEPILSTPHRSCWPMAEGLSVLLAFLAWDWLSDGRADLLRAAGFAILCSVVIYTKRRLQRRKKTAQPDHAQD